MIIHKFIFIIFNINEIKKIPPARRVKYVGLLGIIIETIEKYGYKKYKYYKRKGFSDKYIKLSDNLYYNKTQDYVKPSLDGSEYYPILTLGDILLITKSFFNEHYDIHLVEEKLLYLLRDYSYEYNDDIDPRYNDSIDLIYDIIYAMNKIDKDFIL